ncbi:MAG: hypothetical protein ACTSXN_06485 [Promethearchaeota archaeon]
MSKEDELLAELGQIREFLVPAPPPKEPDNKMKLLDEFKAFLKNLK